jgi:hypothetical protein
LKIKKTFISSNISKFIKFTLIWISQNLAIPFWIVGHIHLSIHNFHDLIEIFSSIGMNILVAIGFLLDYKSNELDKHNQQEKKANSSRENS